MWTGSWLIRPQLGIAGIVTLLLMTAMAGQSVAEEFRVETAIYVEDNKEPAAETLTLFMDGLAYDFMLSGSKEVTILDPLRQRIILLDPVHEQQTRLSTEQILEFTEGARALVAEGTQAEKDTIDPNFEVKFDADAKKLTLTSPYLIYEAVGLEPKHQTLPGIYRQFADWSARLNAVRPDNGPPFGRLKLNESVAAEGLIPKSVTRTIISRKALSRKRFVTRSEHHVVWSLSKTDRDRIGKVSEYLAEFKVVGFQEYHKSDKLASDR